MTTPPALIDIPGYTVHQLLGKGGMAAVYLATQESLHRQVAIKVLLNAHDDAFNTRFVSEARIIATLNHPRIITVHDVAQLPDGRYYIAMEYLSGGDLTRYKGQALPPDHALELIRQIAEGLSVVHRKGIIHRDIKPGNILFREDGSLVLTDFGIAKDLATDTDLTQTGMTLGSPSYCSPEQTHCEALDRRTDIYSLGVILLELLLGQNPFKAGNYTQTVLNHVQMPVPQLPPALAHCQPLLNRMLAKNPRDRFGSAEELLAALQGRDADPMDATLTIPTQARQRNVSSPGKPWLRFTLALLLSGLLGLGGSAGYLYWQWWQEEQRKLAEVETLLAKGHARLAGGQWVSPPLDNAEFYFRQVLTLQADHPGATQGLADLRQKQIGQWLAEGEERLQSNRLTLPPEDNAVFYFQQVLNLEPANAAALAGLQRVVASYIGLAQQAFAKGAWQEAQLQVSKGLALDPDNPTLLEMRQRPAPVRSSAPRKTPIERFFNRLLN